MRPWPLRQDAHLCPSTFHDSEQGPGPARKERARKPRDKALSQSLRTPTQRTELWERRQEDPPAPVRTRVAWHRVLPNTGTDVGFLPPPSICCRGVHCLGDPPPTVSADVTPSALYDTLSPGQEQAQGPTEPESWALEPRWETTPPLRGQDESLGLTLTGRSPPPG